WRYFGSPLTDADLSGYPDAGSVSPFAQEAMAWAVSRGIIKGTSEGTLAPQTSCTRAELAAILMRL
ncbi:MAG TPA: S-layer homology domain-containing protein, partial [Candidatus Olsenella pullicola]|nr:S-layer homology domain-containing protein [Candidatus Olsenella pullicola]